MMVNVRTPFDQRSLRCRKLVSRCHAQIFNLPCLYRNHVCRRREKPRLVMARSGTRQLAGTRRVELQRFPRLDLGRVFGMP
jgi:hypothetical protein